MQRSLVHRCLSIQRRAASPSHGRKVRERRPADRMEAIMKGITSFLWFDDQAEQAANHYVWIFTSAGSKNSEITGLTRYGAAGADAAGRPAGSVMTVAFRLAGQDFVAVNGGPELGFTEAVSFMVNC